MLPFWGTSLAKVSGLQRSLSGPGFPAWNGPGPSKLCPSARQPGSPGSGTQRPGPRQEAPHEQRVPRAGPEPGSRGFPACRLQPHLGWGPAAAGRRQRSPQAQTQAPRAAAGLQRHLALAARTAPLFPRARRPPSALVGGQFTGVKRGGGWARESRKPGERERVRAAGGTSNGRLCAWRREGWDRRETGWMWAFREKTPKAEARLLRTGSEGCKAQCAPISLVLGLLPSRLLAPSEERISQGSRWPWGQGPGSPL